MNGKKARAILGSDVFCEDGGLFDGGHYLAWSVGDAVVVLDDSFTADELEAIAWWMRKKRVT